MDSLIQLIDKALIELENFVVESKYYNGNEELIISTKKVLSLLKDELQKHPDAINERVLSAMHDVGMSTYKEFENTSVGIAIEKVIDVLYVTIPQYINMQPLRADFGKGQPI